jgi:hypothetical protein
MVAYHGDAKLIVEKVSNIANENGAGLFQCIENKVQNASEVLLL